MDDLLFSHVTIGCRDFARAFGFYSALTAELGLVEKFNEPEVPWAGWFRPGEARPLLLLTGPYNGLAHDAGNGQMVAFLAADREMVRRCHALALANGGSDEGAPGLRPQYHAHYYGAYFRDTEGNKLCVCCHNAH